MNPTRFLFYGGIALILLGSLGLVGILDDISSVSFFRPPYWINWVHLLLGITIFTVSFTSYKKLHTGLTLFPAVVATTMGVVGLVFGSYLATRLNIPDLADPSDHAAHLFVGIMAIWAVINYRRGLHYSMQ